VSAKRVLLLLTLKMAVMLGSAAAPVKAPALDVASACRAAS
jgi:hypothetical protein